MSSSYSEFDNHVTAFRSSSSPLQLPSSSSARASMTTTAGKFTIDSLISSNISSSDVQVKLPNPPYVVDEAVLGSRKNNHGRIWSPTVVNDDTSSVSRSAAIGSLDAVEDVPDLRRRHLTTTATFSPASTSACLTPRGGRLSTIWNTWEQQLEESGRHCSNGLLSDENGDHTSTNGFPIVPRFQTGHYDRMLLQSTTSTVATTPVRCLPSLSGEAHQARPEARSFPHPPSTVTDYELPCHRSLHHSHKLVVSEQTTTTRIGTDIPSLRAYHRGYGRTGSCCGGIDGERPNIDGSGGESVAAKRSPPSGSSLEAMLPPQCVAHLPLYAVWLLAERGNTYLNSIGPDGTLLYPFHKRKRFRTSFSPQQLVRLEEAFLANQYMIGSERRELAQSLGLSETQIKVWFQNRRTKQKKDGPQDTSACLRRDLLSSSSASSSSENGDYIDVDDCSAGNSSPSAVSLSPSSMTSSAGPWLQTY